MDNKDKLNKLLNNISFDSEVRFNAHSSYYSISYRLEFLGKKDMISVGDWVTYDVFDVIILDMDETLKKIMKVFGDLMGMRLINDYVFRGDVTAGVKNELQFFSPIPNQYIQVNEVRLSPNLEKEINEMNMSDYTKRT